MVSEMDEARTVPGQGGATQQLMLEVEPDLSSVLESEISFRWYETVTDISPDLWNRCFESRYFARSYSYQQAVEESSPRGVQFHYLVASKEGVVAAIIGCFRYRIPLSTTATGTARRAMSFVERFLPDLFSINGFFVGQLTSVCDHLYGFSQVPPAARSAWLAKCEVAIAKRASYLRSSIIIHKEIPGEDLSLVREALGESYVIAPSLPAMELSLGSLEPFEQQLRKKYRNHYRRRSRLAQQRGLCWEVHRGPLNESLARDIERLYLGVLDRSGTQFERLSSDFFSSLMEHCPGASIVLCWDGEKLVGFMSNVEADKVFHGLYLGYDTAYRDAAVYFNLIYRSLDVALSKGYKTISLGQTSYEIKSALGAKRADLHLAIRARNPFVHALLKCFREHLFPETIVPIRRAFRVGSR